MAKKEKNDAADNSSENIATEVTSDVFLLYFIPRESSMLPEDSLKIKELISEKKFDKVSNVHLILHTAGGDPYTAARIVNILHKRFKKVTVVVPYWAMSAGTLLALGGDEIVMSDLSQLGPLDMQVSHPHFDKIISAIDYTNPISYIVGLVTTASTRFYKKIREDSSKRISSKEAMSLAYANSIKMFEPIIRQLEPIELSRSSRVLQVSKEYGAEFLMNYSLKQEYRISNYVDALISILIYAYPDHGFCIFYDKLKQYGVNVTTSDEYSFWGDIWKEVRDIIDSEVNSTSELGKIIKILPLANAQIKIK